MLTRQGRPLRNLFAAFLVLGSAACAAAPHDPVGLRLEMDGPRVERIDLRRTDGAWRVAGTARCEWPATPARTRLVLLALDAEGREVGAVPVTSELLLQTQRHKRDQRFTFSADMSVPARAVRLVLARN